MYSIRFLLKFKDVVRYVRDLRHKYLISVAINKLQVWRHRLYLDFLGFHKLVCQLCYMNNRDTEINMFLGTAVLNATREQILLVAESATRVAVSTMTQSLQCNEYRECWWTWRQAQWSGNSLGLGTHCFWPSPSHRSAKLSKARMRNRGRWFIADDCFYNSKWLSCKGDVIGNGERYVAVAVGGFAVASVEWLESIISHT